MKSKFGNFEVARVGGATMFGTKKSYRENMLQLLPLKLALAVALVLPLEDRSCNACVIVCMTPVFHAPALCVLSRKEVQKASPASFSFQ